ncbi:MAG: LacI family DNA-binding transcriptional regulator [Sedimentisphaerales bacterium]
MDKCKIETLSPISAVAKVAALLREDIRSGRYAVGDPIETERVLAGKLRVSRETVRQSLSILRSERLVIRQQGRGTFVTNPAYAANSGRETLLIGALVYEKDYYFGTILQGAFSHATRRGYILATGINSTEDSEKEHVEAFIKSGVRGVILAPTMGKHSSHAYDRLVKEKIPVVLIDNKIHDRYEDFVSVDNYQGTVLAAKHLIDLGHTAIGYIGYDIPDDLPCQPERLLGFTSMCRQSGIKVSDKWIIEVNSDNCLEKMRAVLQQENHPTAFVFYNDYLATRMLDAAHELNMKVPEDISIVGFDDSPIAKTCSVPITTICPRPRELGKIMVDTLVNKIENTQPQIKQSILIEPRLVIRKSTAPPKKV